MTTMFDHRISRAVRDIQARLDAVDADTRASLEIAATMDAGDRLMFRDFPTRALAAGVLTLDEATTLNRVAETWADASTAERIVWIRTMFELARQTI